MIFFAAIALWNKGEVWFGVQKASQEIAKIFSFTVGSGGFCWLRVVVLHYDTIGWCLSPQMTLLEGSIAASGTFAYVAQQAWILNATLRDNILFGKEFDEERQGMFGFRAFCLGHVRRKAAQLRRVCSNHVPDAGSLYVPQIQLCAEQLLPEA